MFLPSSTSSTIPLDSFGDTLKLSLEVGTYRIWYFPNTCCLPLKKDQVVWQVLLLDCLLMLDAVHRSSGVWLNLCKKTGNSDFYCHSILDQNQFTYHTATTEGKRVDSLNWPRIALLIPSNTNSLLLRTNGLFAHRMPPGSVNTGNQTDFLDPTAL